MPGKQIASNQSRTRPQLLDRISRLRRRLNRRLDQLADRLILPNSWREYVRQRPGSAVLAAAGFGFVLARWFGPRGASARLGDGVEKLAARSACRHVWRLLLGLAAGRRRGHAEANDG
jgi:hypothetical protein